MVKAVKGKILRAAAALFFAAAAFILLMTNAHAAGYRAVLADMDEYEDCLSDYEEGMLLGRMETLAEKVECNIGIVITSNLNGYTDEQYADEFGYSCFGDSDWAVLVLLNTHDNPQYLYYEDQLMFNNGGYEMYYSHLDRIFDKIYAGLEKSDGSYDFYAGCDNFCDALQSYGAKGFAGVMMRFWQYFFDNITIMMFLLAVSIVIPIVVVGGFSSGYKKKKPVSAAVYMNRDRTRITNSVDSFVREYTTSYTTSSSSSGGGSRGGGGGGSHGGGGGHHR